MRVIIVSGLSGAGKSVALHMLEDLGCYCVDNLPVALLASFITYANDTQDQFGDRVAVGIDARNPPDDIATVPDVVERIRAKDIHCDLIFLTASEETLIARDAATGAPLPSFQVFWFAWHAAHPTLPPPRASG